MTGEPTTTIIGNLTGDPELRFTPSGAAVANFTVAATPSRFNKQINGWEDGETWFVSCSVWKEYAENVAASLERGMRVIVAGRLRSRSWEDRDGNKRVSIELDVDEVGPSLKFATARLEKRSKKVAISSDDWSQVSSSEEPPF